MCVKPSPRRRTGSGRTGSRQGGTVPMSLCARKRIRRSCGVVAVLALLFPAGLPAATPAGAASASKGANVAAAATVPPNMDSHFDLPLPWFGNQVHVHNLFLDPTGWDANNRLSEADINAATSALVRSGYFDGLQQYGIPHPAFDGSINSSGVCDNLVGIGPTAGPLWTDLLKFMSCEGVTPGSGVVSDPVVLTPLTPVTNIYNLFVPDRGVVAFPDGTKSCGDFGATHAATVPLVFYAILPASCAKDVGSLMALVGHEDVETLTDPVIGLGLFDTASSGTPSLSLTSF